jgi:hypothetical protein
VVNANICPRGFGSQAPKRLVRKYLTILPTIPLSLCQKALRAVLPQVNFLDRLAGSRYEARG